MARRGSFIGWGFCLFLTCLAQSPKIHDSRLPAKGCQQTRIEIGEFGRYRIQVQSDQGVALEVVDRMVGPLARDGVAGHRDGSVDLFLEPGTYLIRLFGHEEASGKARLSAIPFRDLGVEALKPGTTLEAQLGDLEARSYWVFVEDQPLYLEAMGRCLKDCRLWLGGNWSAPALPRLTVFEPTPGMPMLHAEFHHALAKGWVKLTLYGGPEQPWSSSAEGSPVWVHLGVPRLAQSGRTEFQMSAFGRASFLAVEETNTFLVSRAEKKPTTLTRAPWKRDESRFVDGISARIEKNSRDPWCMLEGRSGTKFQWITVIAEPGASLTLDYFTQARRYPLDESGAAYLIASHQAEMGGAQLDATGIITHPDAEDPIFSQVVHLGPMQPIDRTFNLNQEMDLFLMVEETATYVLEEFPGGSGSGRYRFERFAVDRPYNYRPPEFSTPNRAFNLARGLNVLTVDPVARGEVRLRIARQSDLGTGAVQPVRHALLMPKVELPEKEQPYVLWLNRRGAIPQGVDVRRLPVDLTQGLTVTLPAGARLSLPIRIQTRSTLQAPQQEVTVTVKGMDWQLETPLEPGIHELVLSNTRAEETLCQLSLMEAPLRPTPMAEPEDMSRYLPRLEMGEPLFDDFSRHDKKLFLLRIDIPSLYRIETSGHLATSLLLRSRLDTSLVQAQTNGTGRNALLQPYLKPGDYLVEVTVLGQSEGRLGLHLIPGELVEGQELVEGTVGRITLPKDKAVRYPIKIEQPGRFRLASCGVGRWFAHRLEDEHGWPLMTPGGRGEIEQTFSAGAYSLMSLAEDLDTKRVTYLERLEAPARFEGKGLHRLIWNGTIENLWRSGPPDRYVFDVPSEMDIRIEVGKGMTASLFRETTSIDVFPGGEVWSRSLVPGTYRLEVVRSDEDDRFPYHVSLETDVLAPGLEQTFSSLPATCIVSVPTDGLYDIGSFGQTDIRVQLLDDQGNVVTEQDDAKDDWNVKMAVSLRPGQYHLSINEMSDVMGAVTFRLTQRDRQTVATQTIPFTCDRQVDEGVLEIPFRTNQAGLAAFTAKLGEDLVMELSRDARVLARTRDALWIPLQKDSDYQLRLFRIFPAPKPISVTAAWSDMTAADPVGSLPKDRVVHVEDAMKGTLLLEADGALVSSGVEKPLVPMASSWINLQEGAAWIKTTGKGGRVSRFTLSETRVGRMVVGAMPWAFEVEPERSGPHLIEVTSPGGHLGAFIRTTEDDGKADLWAGMHPAESRTVAGLPPLSQVTGASKNVRTGWVRLWSIDSEPKDLEARVTLVPLELDTPASGPVGEQGWSGTLARGHAVALELDATPGQWAFWVSRGMIAFYWHEGQARTLVAAGDTHRYLTTSIPVDRIYLANAWGTDGVCRVAPCAVPPGPESSIISPEHGSDHVCTDPQTFRYTWESSPGQWVFARGCTSATRCYLNDGIRMTDPPFPADLGGTLEIDLPAGWARVWMGTKETTAADFFGPPPQTPILPLNPGPNQLDANPQRWSLSLEHAALLVLTCDVPGMTALCNAQGVIGTSAGASPKQRRLTHFLQPGAYEIWTRPFSGKGQDGHLFWQAIAPEPLDEHEHPKRLIADGEIHVYRFDVDRSGNVGVGIRPDEDRCNVTLVRRPFVPVAQGIGMFESLEPGSYLLLVEGIGLPVLYRPIVLGLQERREIPPDVRRSFETGGQP